MQIMTAQATAGASTEFKYSYGTKPINIFVSGTFDGATVTLQAKTPDGGWVDVKDYAITVPQMISIEAFPFVGRLNITTPGVSTLLDAHVIGQVTTP